MFSIHFVAYGGQNYEKNGKEPNVPCHFSIACYPLPDYLTRCSIGIADDEQATCAAIGTATVEGVKGGGLKVEG
jgi:hypothetical protein